MALILQTGDIGVDLIILGIIFLVCFLAATALKQAEVAGALKWATIICVVVGAVIYLAELLIA